MKNFILQNWYKATMALSFFILASAVLIYSVKENKAYGNPPLKKESYQRQCVSAVALNNVIYVIWADGSVESKGHY